MIDLRKFLLIGTLFAATASSAFANPMSTVNGSKIDMSGTVKVVGSGATSGLHFTTNPEAAFGGTNGLAFFNGPASIILSNTFTFAGIHPGKGELLFSTTAFGNTLQFYVTGYSYSGNTLTFTGYLSDNGVAGSNATLVETLGAAAGGDKGNFYTGELTLTPEPNSIVLLGTGLLAACGMMSIRRRRMLGATA